MELVHVEGQGWPVVLVHGIRTLDPMGSIGKLAGPLAAAGFKVMVVDYGYLPIGFAWVADHSLSARLSQIAPAKAAFIGHSNGCALIYGMHRPSLPYFGFINPALDRELAPKALAGRVYFNRNDWAVYFASLIPLGHPWGAQGRYGYSGADANIVNVDCGDAQLGEHAIHGHTAMFSDAEWWGNRLAADMKKAMTGCGLF